MRPCLLSDCTACRTSSSEMRPWPSLSIMSKRTRSSVFLMLLRISGGSSKTFVRRMVSTRLDNSILSRAALSASILRCCSDCCLYESIEPMRSSVWCSFSSRHSRTYSSRLPLRSTVRWRSKRRMERSAACWSSRSRLCWWNDFRFSSATFCLWLISSTYFSDCFSRVRSTPATCSRFSADFCATEWRYSSRARIQRSRRSSDSASRCSNVSRCRRCSCSCALIAACTRISCFSRLMALASAIRAFCSSSLASRCASRSSSCLRFSAAASSFARSDASKRSCRTIAFARIDASF
mmetsp:Transcript_12307/g.32203  ORF Transcript_12307/g.32203 Transcript_12307/m.32203 type:complete len:294 (+) Transcript_12307:390-1271(+)